MVEEILSDLNLEGASRFFEGPFQTAGARRGGRSPVDLAGR